MTPTPSLEHVLHRLEKLEKENRRLKGFGFALAVAGAVGLLAAAQPAQNKDKVAEFEKFILRDQAGKQRAAFGMTADGPEMRFLDNDGRTTGSIGTAKAGMFLRLNNADGGLQTGVNLNQAGVVVVSYGTTGRLLSGTMAIQETTGGFTK